MLSRRVGLLAVAGALVLYGCEAGYTISVDNQMDVGIYVGAQYPEGPPTVTLVPARSRGIGPVDLGPFDGRLTVLDLACRELESFSMNNQTGPILLTVVSSNDMRLTKGAIEGGIVFEPTTACGGDIDPPAAT